jgi:hypothetical protein
MDPLLPLLHLKQHTFRWCVDVSLMYRTVHLLTHCLMLMVYLCIWVLWLLLRVTGAGGVKGGCRRAG